ncbi:MAG: GDCCVxC domain-containing (seleno)protein [Paracoccaceae bacterium]
MAEGIVTRSDLTCPACGVTSAAEMPTEACQFFFDCPACGAVLRPLPGDCCVFCSYGSVPCPPIQAGEGCCGSAQ